MGKRTVLFLGAGASEPFGYPLTKAIFKLIKERLPEQLFRRDPKDFPHAAAHEEALQRYLSQLLPGFREEDVELPPITDVLSLIDHLLLARNVPLPKFRSREVQTFRELLERAILEVLNEPSDKGKAAAGEPLLHRLAQWIYDSAMTPGNPVAIISTNYDTALESVLYEKLDQSRRDIRRVNHCGLLPPHRGHCHPIDVPARLSVRRAYDPGHPKRGGPRRSEALPISLSQIRFPPIHFRDRWPGGFYRATREPLDA